MLGVAGGWMICVGFGLTYRLYSTCIYLYVYIYMYEMDTHMYILYFDGWLKCWDYAYKDSWFSQLLDGGLILNRSHIFDTDTSFKHYEMICFVKFGRSWNCADIHENMLNELFYARFFQVTFWGISSFSGVKTWPSFGWLKSQLGETGGWWISIPLF